MNRYQLTSWRVVGLHGQRLNLTLTVSSERAAVVVAIEQAAAAHGIELQRRPPAPPARDDDQP